MCSCDEGVVHGSVNKAADLETHHRVIVRQIGVARLLLTGMKLLAVAWGGHGQVKPTPFTIEHRWASYGLYFRQQRASSETGRRMLSPPKRFCSKGRCRNASATSTSQEHVDLAERTNSLTEHSLATVFRWPSAFESQAVSVLGTPLIRVPPSAAIARQASVLRQGRLLQRLATSGASA